MQFRVYIIKPIRLPQNLCSKSHVQTVQWKCITLQ